MAEHISFELLFVIINEGYSSLVMQAGRAAGATGGTILHAKGAGAEEAQRFFGISISAEKEMVLIVCKAEKRNAILNAIAQEAGQTSPAKGIAFSLPVSAVKGLWAAQQEDDDA
jgi:nitrogen regulatory protein PII